MEDPSAIRRKLTDWLGASYPEHYGKVPEALLSFWVAHYGQAVSFEVQRADTGARLTVDRVFDVEDEDDVPADAPDSWRGSPEVLDYSIDYFERAMPNWEDHDEILPFAGVEVSEATAFDMLVLDFRDGDARLGIWLHEESFGYEEPHVVAVVGGLGGFLRQVTS